MSGPPGTVREQTRIPHARGVSRPPGEEQKMRHLTKRLLAGFLAGLTLFGSAYAVETNDFAGGTASGEMQLEGPEPEEIIDVQVPTDNTDIFNFYLDPNERLRKTGGGRFSEFNPDIDDGKLYFLNRDASGNLTGLSCKSDDLYIYNRGMTPLNVDLSVAVSASPYASFAFTQNPDFLTDSGDVVTAPSMYLALASGITKVPVTTVQEETGSVNKATIKTWIGGNEDRFETVWTASDKYHSISAKTA